MLSVLNPQPVPPPPHVRRRGNSRLWRNLNSFCIRRLLAVVRLNANETSDPAAPGAVRVASASCEALLHQVTSLRPRVSPGRGEATRVRLYRESSRPNAIGWAKMSEKP